MASKYKYNYGDLVACYTRVEADGSKAYDPPFGSKKHEITYKRVVLGWIESRFTDGDGRRHYYVRWSDRPTREPSAIQEQQLEACRKLYLDAREGRVSHGIIVEGPEK